MYHNWIHILALSWTPWVFENSPDSEASRSTAADCRRAMPVKPLGFIWNEKKMFAEIYLIIKQSMAIWFPIWNEMLGILPIKRATLNDPLWMRSLTGFGDSPAQLRAQWIHGRDIQSVVGCGFRSGYGTGKGVSHIEHCQKPWLANLFTASWYLWQGFL